MAHTIGATTVATYATEMGYELGPNDTTGEPVSIPYQQGEIAGNRTLKGRDYTLYLGVFGRETSGVYTRARYLTNVQALAALLMQPDANGNPQPFTLTRILTVSAGTQTATCQAILRADSFRVRQASWSGGYVAPVLRLLDPYFLAGATKLYA